MYKHRINPAPVRRDVDGMAAIGRTLYDLRGIRLDAAENGNTPPAPPLRRHTCSATGCPCCSPCSRADQPPRRPRRARARTAPGEQGSPRSPRTGAGRPPHTNSHKKSDGTPLNLRDDLDEKFEGLANLVKSVVLDLGGMKSDIRGIRREALVDREAAATDRKHIRKLEDTLTPAQLKRVRAENKETPLFHRPYPNRRTVRGRRALRVAGIHRP
jgi:hypothetical protein